MRLLLDTHVLLWLDTDPERLSAYALAAIRDRRNEVLVSAVTAWELSIKHRLGKLPSATALLESYHASLAHYGFGELGFTSTHALAERALRSSHKDPFDRALAAQASTEKLELVSNDALLREGFGFELVW